MKQRIDACPLPDDGVCRLPGKDMKRILQHAFDQLRSLNAVNGLLHRLGYLSPVRRPQKPRADPVAQDEFKKVWRAAGPDSNPTYRPSTVNLQRRRSPVRPARDADDLSEAF